MYTPSSPARAPRRATRSPTGSRRGHRRADRAAPAACILALTSLVAPETASAQEPGPLVTDRPDQTESALVVPAGFAQFELGMTYADEDGAEDPSSLNVGAVLARVGLGGGFEARLSHAGWSSVRAGGETVTSGLGDAGLGLKYAPRDPDDRTWLGILGSISLPTGEDALGSARVDPSVRLLYARSLSERFSAGANLGLAWETVWAPDAGTGPDDPQTEVEAPYSAVLGIAASERVALFVEAFGGIGLGERQSTHSLDGGLTLLLRDGWQLDASAGVGLDDDAEDWFVGGGLSLRVPR